MNGVINLLVFRAGRKYDLRLYRGIIEKVISATFGQGSAIADVHRDYFILLAEHQLLCFLSVIWLIWGNIATSYLM